MEKVDDQLQKNAKMKKILENEGNNGRCEGIFHYCGRRRRSR